MKPLPKTIKKRSSATTADSGNIRRIRPIELSDTNSIVLFRKNGLAVDFTVVSAPRWSEDLERYLSIFARVGWDPFFDQGEAFCEAPYIDGDWDPTDAYSSLRRLLATTNQYSPAEIEDHLTRLRYLRLPGG